MSTQHSLFATRTSAEANWTNSFSRGQDAGVACPPTAACIAVAGPVLHNKVAMTNRNWVIDGSEVRARCIVPSHGCSRITHTT